MNVVLADRNREQLLPFTFTRPVAALRIGILTIADKWRHWLGAEVGYQTEPYLNIKFPLKQTQDNWVIHGGLLPNAKVVAAVQNLKLGERLLHQGQEIARRTHDLQGSFELANIVYEGDVLVVENPWDIFAKNGEALQLDFDLLTKNRTSQPIPNHCTVIAPENVFIEEGAHISCSILNASTGPIYIGKNAQILEGCLIRGPLSLGEGSVLKMGAKIYGPTTLGPYCRGGGEINNSVLFGYSNKGHEGYLGNSVLGEWCNLGADTNTSNLKNNYAPVRLWSYATEGFAHTGLQFCGLMMADHAKAGINTMFNTATVVGVASNVFGSGFPRTFIPSFSWGGAAGFTTYRTNKAFEAAQAMMGRRNLEFDKVEQEILETVFELTKKWRKES